MIKKSYSPNGNGWRKKKLLLSTPKSHWAIGLRNIFFSISEVPLAAVVSIAAVLGLLILGSYAGPFYFLVSDLSALLTLGGLTVLATAVVVFGLVFAFFTPAGLAGWYHMSAHNRIRFELSGVRLFLVQLGVVSLYLFVGEFIKWRNCGDVAVEQFAMAGIGVLGTVAVFVEGIWAERKSPAHVWVVLLSVVVLSGFFASLPYLIINRFAHSFLSRAWMLEILVSVAWLLLLAMNAGLAKSKSIGTILLGVFILTGLATVFSLTQGSRDVPQAVATVMHVRSPKPVDFVITKDACENLQKSAVFAGISPQSLQCMDKTPSTIHVQIAWNIGSRLILEFAPIFDGRGEKMVYLTLSKESVLGLMPDPESTKLHKVAEKTSTLNTPVVCSK